VPDKSITVDVPEERVAEFYAWFARFLATPPGEGPPRGPRGGFGHGGHHDVERREWSDDDVEVAARLYGRLSPPARRLFDLLIDAPGVPVEGNRVAAELGLENGAHGVAGILAWPGRWSRKLGRTFPITTAGRPDGGTDYSMGPRVAGVFARARASL
jgi:hypothetical protein